MNNNAEMIKDLRALAKFLEANPNLPKLETAGVYAFSYHMAMTEAKPADVVRNSTGTWKKDGNAATFELKRDFGKITVTYMWERESVCRKVVTVERKVVRDWPEGTVLPEMVDVERDVETVTWECDPILAEAK